MEFSGSVQDGQTTVMLVGDLDEEFDAGAFARHLKQNPETGQPVRIVLRDVESGNSTGISLFLQTIKTSNLPVRYAEVPHWILIQMNFFRDFLLKNVLVESILVDCTEDGTNDSEPMVLKLGSDIPILKEYPDEPIRVQRGGKSFVAGLEAEDLSFISYHFERFRVLQS